MFKDLESEQCVLGCLLSDKECQEHLSELEDIDFTSYDTKTVFKAIQDVKAQGSDIDIITVNGELLLKHSYSSDFQGLEILNDFTRKVPTTVNFSSYLDNLKKATACRKLELLTSDVTNGRIPIKNVDFNDISKTLESYKTDMDNCIIGFANIAEENYIEREKVLSGFDEIDYRMSGFYMGETTVWTGKTGQGKSTFVNQMVCESINQGFNTCIYSGELTNEQLKYWIKLQFAGEKNIVKLQDEKTGFINYGLLKEVSKRIDEWVNGKLFIYNNKFEINNENPISILEAFEYAHKQYNCRVFVVDNIMSARFMESSKDDYYTQQSKFAGELASFAKINNVHVHIIAHPKKTVNEIVGNEDISGTMDIANKADNVFVVYRIDKEKYPNEKKDGELVIRKNRSNGITNKSVDLFFNNKSRRFATPRNRYEKHYGWEEF